MKDLDAGDCLERERSKVERPGRGRGLCLVESLQVAMVVADRVARGVRALVEVLGPPRVRDDVPLVEAELGLENGHGGAERTVE